MIQPATDRRPAAGDDGLDAFRAVVIGCSIALVLWASLMAAFAW